MSFGVTESRQLTGEDLNDPFWKDQAEAMGRMCVEIDREGNSSAVFTLDEVICDGESVGKWTVTFTKEKQ